MWSGSGAHSGLLCGSRQACNADRNAGAHGGGHGRSNEVARHASALHTLGPYAQQGIAQGRDVVLQLLSLVADLQQLGPACQDSAGPGSPGTMSTAAQAQTA